jgi:hypothetical protein
VRPGWPKGASQPLLAAPESSILVSHGAFSIPSSWSNAPQRLPAHSQSVSAAPQRLFCASQGPTFAAQWALAIPVCLPRRASPSAIQAQPPSSDAQFASTCSTLRLGRNAVGLGGTANLAVFGGNLPPSQTHAHRSLFSDILARSAVGLVARVCLAGVAQASRLFRWATRPTEWQWGRQRPVGSFGPGCRSPFRSASRRARQAGRLCYPC